MKSDTVPVGIVNGRLVGDKLRLPNNLELDFNGHNPCVRVELEEYNKTASRSIEGTGTGRIIVNGIRVLSFEFPDIGRGLLIASYKIAALRGIPFDLTDPNITDMIVGTVVKYNELEATIRAYDRPDGVLELETEDGTVETSIFNEEIGW